MVQFTGQVKFHSNDLKKKPALGDNELHRIMDVIYRCFMAEPGRGAVV